MIPTTTSTPPKEIENNNSPIAILFPPRKFTPITYLEF